VPWTVRVWKRSSSWAVFQSWELVRRKRA
jgi:hypothetical protein